MMNCDYYQELISRLLDGDLSRQERDDLAAHVKRCPDCAAVYVAFRSLSEHLGSDLVEPPASLHENIMADVRRENMRERNKRRSAHRRWQPLLAAAACLVLIVSAGVGIPRLRSKLAAPQAAPADVPAVAEEFAEAAPRAAEFGRNDAPSLGMAARSDDAVTQENVESAAEAPAEEPAAAPAPEPSFDLSAYEGIADAILDRETSAAFRDILTGEQISLPGKPERELTVVYQDEGEVRQKTVLICGDKAVYIQNDGDSYYRIDAAADELLELLGLT